MSKLLVSIVLYFSILFIVSFIIPQGLGYDSPAVNTSSLINLSNQAVDYNTWGISDNLATFGSFFTFSAYNPLGMPSELAVLLSLFTWAMLVLFIYCIMVLIRGGGNA